MDPGYGIARNAVVSRQTNLVSWRALVAIIPKKKKSISVRPMHIEPVGQLSVVITDGNRRGMSIEPSNIGGSRDRR